MWLPDRDGRWYQAADHELCEDFGHGDFADRILELAGTGVSFNYQNPKEILSLGGGQIQITGTGAGAYGISLQNQDALSSAGSILLYGGTEGIVLRDRGARFGSRTGTSVTNGRAALTLRGDVDYQALSGVFTNTADGTGGVVMESHSSSFSSPFDYKNFDLGSTISSLRVGKSTNTTSVTANAAVSIAGPISIYGGNRRECPLDCDG